MQVWVLMPLMKWKLDPTMQTLGDDRSRFFLRHT